MTTLTDQAVRRATAPIVDLTALTMAHFNQTAAPDTFIRDGHTITQARDDDSGRFGDDGLADIVTAVTAVFGRQTVVGQSVAAFDDPEGEYLDQPGKGVAFRDVDELGDIEDENDLTEANILTQTQAGQVADQLAAAAQAARSDGTIGGLQRRATLKAAGMDIAAFNDGDGVFGTPETSYVAVGYQNNSVDWDSPNLADQEGIEFTLFDPEEAEDLADALRGALAAAAPVKAGVPRKLDRLSLDGRIPLQPGERLTGSAAIDALRYSDLDPVLAATSGLQGPQLRVGFVHNEDTRDWNAGDNGETAVLDAAGFAQLQAAMDAIPARANAQRAQYAREVLDPETAKVAPLRARIEAIRDRVFEGNLPSPEKMEQIRLLEDKLDALISATPAWSEYVDAHRRRGKILQKYIRYEGDRIFSDPMSDEDRAEYERMRERTNQLNNENYNISRIDDLHNQINRVAESNRDLTSEEKDEIADLRSQIKAVFHETAEGPGIDDMLFAGRIPGQWADLRYEVHGSDSGWEDNPTGIGTWTLRLGIIPKNAPLDVLDDGMEAAIEPEEIVKMMRGFEKVFATATAQTAAAAGRFRMPAHLRRRAAIDTRSIRQIADSLEIPYELIRGRA